MIFQVGVKRFSTSRISESASQGRLAVVTRWRNHDIALLWLAAVIPVLLVSLIEHRIPLLFTILITIIVFQLWLIIFRLVTRASTLIVTGHDVVHAVLIGLLVPLDTALWLIIVSTSFGYVFAERLFGGRGFGFINPVILTLCFILQAQGVALNDTPIASISAWWLMPGMAGLLWFELVSYRTIAGFSLAVLMASLWMGLPDFLSWQNLTPLACVILYLGTDPGSGASCNPGRWLHGLLFGLIFLVLVDTNSLSLAPSVNAALLASLCVPLIDYLVVYVDVYVRRRRRV